MLTENPAHKQLRNFVAERMRTAILDGVYKPGEWLRQEKLAQELGVSQMPVREALKELAAEGLIEHVPYRGARVIAFSATDVSDLYAHRAFLEGRAAFSAAQNITPQELDELKRLLVDMQANSAPESVVRYRELNRRFHQVVFTASRHDYLIRTLEQIWETFPTMLIANFPATATHPLPEREMPDISEHESIIDALERRDSASAETSIRDHILETGSQLVRSLKR